MRIANNPLVRQLIEIALTEDISSGDVTSSIAIPKTMTGKAVIRCKQETVVAGNDIARAVCQRIDPELVYTVILQDGLCADPGSVIAELEGFIRSILSAERTVLNFLQRMSGIATQTSFLVKKLKGYSTQLLDTRKTAPGWRILDKYAVEAGGGKNHRMNLADGILIKDNHIKAVGGVKQAVRMAVLNRPHPLRIQVEVSSFNDAMEAVEAGADALLLDNLTPEQVSKIVSKMPQHIILETSGNISPENLLEYASTGIHFVSMGALTHSSRAADISLKLV